MSSYQYYTINYTQVLNPIPALNIGLIELWNFRYIKIIRNSSDTALGYVTLYTKYEVGNELEEPIGFFQPFYSHILFEKWNNGDLWILERNKKTKII